MLILYHDSHKNKRKYVFYDYHKFFSRDWVDIYPLNTILPQLLAIT